jgi:tetratricopeptide (TPR) repeat protein
MKRFFATVGIVCLLMATQAQKPSLTKAYNYFYEKNFVKAKEMIDLCIADAKMATKAQTWLYKGNIEMQLAYQEYGAKEQDNNYQIQYPKAPIEAYDAFVKALAINKNVEGFDMSSPDDALSRFYPFMLIRGAELVIKQQYKEAIEVLERGITSYEMVTPPVQELDGDLYFYYAYANEMLGNVDAATLNYEKAIKDGSKEIMIYIRLIEIYKKQKNEAKILEIINEGKNRIPDNPSLAVSEIDYYYFVGNKAKGKELLKKLPTSLYADADALTNLANIYLKDTNYLEAKELLNKAIAYNPNNLAIIFNLGVCNYSLSEIKFNQASELNLNGRKEEAAVIKAEEQQLLNDAQRYFEQYLAIEPNEKEALHALRSIYIRKGETGKADEINKKIESLK